MESQTITFAPPLPCAACGQSATVATGQMDPLNPGSWIITPLCKRCTLATAANYGLVPTNRND